MLFDLSDSKKFEFFSIIPPEIIRYLSDKECPYEIKNKFLQLADEMYLYWGEVNKKIYQKWLKILYRKSTASQNVEEKMVLIENYLRNINYYEIKSKREELIQQDSLSHGYVYVLSEQKYMPNIVKIGMTESLYRDGFKRATELSTTGLPGNYKVEYQKCTIISKMIESKILDNFENFLETKEIGHRTETIFGNKKEIYRIEKKITSKSQSISLKVNYGYTRKKSMVKLI